MKKLLAVALIVALLIPCAVADEDWYYPYGFSSETTYDAAVATLLSMYKTPEDRVRGDKTVTVIYPIGYTLFDIKLNAIMIQKNIYSDKFKDIVVRLKDTVDQNGPLRFVDIVTFCIRNSKTSLIYVEPTKITYDINGKAVVKAFLDDPSQFAEDFMNPKKDFECMMVWDDIILTLEKTGNEY